MTPDLLALSPRDAWVLRRILTRKEVNGELEVVAGPFREFAALMAGLPPKARPAALDVFLSLTGDPDAAARALAEIDPEGPPPARPTAADAAEAAVRRFATLADVRGVMGELQWLWPGFIPAARISGIAAYEGIGKTRLAMDLARRIFHGLPWPDGQAPTLTAGTGTLWICADGQQDDLIAIAEAFNIPDHAIILNTWDDEPYGGTELDAREDLERLESAIVRNRPGLVFIDTLTNSTKYDICRATETKALMTPLRDIAQRTKTAIIPLMHLSLEGQALGRRVKGITRTIVQLECPDPDHPERLRLAVVKSFDKKPPPLGVTMADAGADYDTAPPEASKPGKRGKHGKPGRPPEARDQAKEFLRRQLAERSPGIGNELAAKWAGAGGSKSTLWRAAHEMEEAGELDMSFGPGTGEQTEFTLKKGGPAAGPPRAGEGDEF